MSPTLTILVPVFNEEHTLSAIMQRLAADCPDAEIIYIDDGSTDGSRAILEREKRLSDVVLTPVHGGKGAAIRAGIARATGKYTVIQDADLEYNPAEIAKLLEVIKGSDPLRPEGLTPLSQNIAVFGSRFLQANPNLYKRYLLGNKTLTGIVNLCFGAKLTDSYTCYKLLPTELFRALELQSNGFELEAEICCKCLKRGIVIREVPITYHPRSLEEGKKIRFTDAIKGILMILRIRLGL